MAGFQRPNPNGPKTPAQSGSKIAILGVLLLVLGGAMFMNFGNRPRNADASGGASGAEGGLAPTAGSAQLLAQISDDPTTRLLRAPDATTKQFEAIPKDPFQPSASLLKRLQKTQTGAVVPTKIVVPETRAPQPTPNLYAANLKVQAIYRDGENFKALINGAPATLGTIVADCQVINIASDGVQFQPLNQPPATRFTLALRPR